MTRLRLTLLCSTLLLCSNRMLTTVQASPTGASACPADGAAVGGSHLRENGDVTTGRLSQGGFVLQVNDGEQTIQDGGVLKYTIAPNPLYEFNLTVTGATNAAPTFKGILMRIDGTTTDQVTPYSADGDGIFKVASVCGDVGSVTHASNVDKTAATAMLSLDQPATHNIDVTVVVRNDDAASIYYYSRFTLQVLQGQVGSGPTTATSGKNDTNVTTNETNTTTTPSKNETEPTETPPTTDTTLVAATVFPVIAQEESLSILTSALQKVFLDAALQETTRNYTVFAPTNDAFKDLDPKYTATSSGAVWDAHLIGMLLNHVIQDQVYLTTDLKNAMAIQSMFGEEMVVTVNEQGIFLQGPAFSDAQIVIPDLLAGNGVVHIVNTFFAPTFLTLTTADVVGNLGGFARFLQLVVMAKLDDEVRDEGRTLLAPTDTSIAALPEAFLSLLSTNTSLLEDVVSYHIFNSVVSSFLMLDGTAKTVETISGEMLNVSVTKKGDTNTFFINNVPLTDVDYLAMNGIVHIPSQVLLPPALAEFMAAPPAVTTLTITVWDVISNRTDLQQLHSMLLTAGLDVNLNTTMKNITVLAPNNDAFLALSEDVLTAVEAKDDLLLDVLSYHVIQGTYLAADLKDGMVLQSITGVPLTVSMNDTAGTVMIQNATVLIPDLLASNGVVHVMNAVLIPETALELMPEPSNVPSNVPSDIPSSMPATMEPTPVGHGGKKKTKAPSPPEIPETEDTTPPTATQNTAPSTTPLEPTAVPTFENQKPASGAASVVRSIMSSLLLLLLSVLSSSWSSLW